MLELEDYRILLTALRLVTPSEPTDYGPLMHRLEKTVKEMTSDEETTVSKFQQEVFDTAKTLPGAKVIFNCQRHCVEKDIVLTRYKGQSVQEHHSPSKGLVIEVDGVYHYPRNSEDPLGKNLLKFRTFKSLGYHSNSFAVPYYAWAILEGSKRRSYL